MRYNSNEITISLVETCNVTACAKEGEGEGENGSSSPQREMMSAVDQWQSKSSHWLGFSLRFEGALDVRAVKEGLEKTLYHIPALGARVDQQHQSDTNNDSREKLYEFVLEQSNQGVILEHYKGSTSRKDIHLPDDTDTRQVWKEAGLEAPGPGYSGEASLKDPLLRVRLIVFETQQVSYLCIGINHGLGDGHSICDILQTWSHFSSTTTTKKDPAVSLLPDHLARRRVLGQRVTAAHKPAKSIDDLKDRLEEDTGCPYDPFSIWTVLWRLLPGAIWCMSRQVELELRVSAEKLATLKAKITKQSPPGQWVSSLEVLCASLLFARQVTTNSSTTTTNNKESLEQQQHNLHVACDLRGRSKRFSADYFGNAAFDFREPMKLPVGNNKDGTTTIQSIAQEVHRAIRTGLSNAEENACRSKDWFEAARHLGLTNDYDIWPMVFDALQGTGTFINSWDKKRWLDCDMNGVSASSMVAWFGTLQNLYVEVPRHSSSGDSTIHLALPPEHASKFRSYCQVHKEELPFEIVN